MSATTMPPALGPVKDQAVAAALGRRRKAADRLVRLLSYAATLIGLVFLASILLTLFYKGFGAMNLSVFTEVTKPPGSEGGLLNAIVGSLIQVALATAIGTPIGMLVGTFLAEYAKGSAFGNLVRFVSDILLSAPSILIGLFVYQLLVLPFGGFSGWAGVAALTIIIIPIVVRTTEDMLTLIPNTLREAVIGLGAPKWKMIVLICWRAATSGIITGILLGIARIAGETAPLLFTSLGNNAWSTNLNGPLPSLPITIYSYAGSPFQDWIELAWAGALLITLAVLLLNILARSVLGRGK
ncbi:phosphate ABC transporter permease PstA [Siccirubricoccus sp. KC 17139]|uniref:Phosphate transport system permease protein PstA n=1 Tax=Siccirubricoccus soli TaxID=2899147 RepID=A0ABT1D0Z6_9PROT|nr:phosphate ABC transporter permease PstA [Siccirubricoccus soli]MCO6415557.1 phosphate ABC transporter permease PstA [Siccirubricoccus soli]MCP2681689.1 phosphate ABC transporter permease PstA [Siccirubricoccus soli]